MSQRSLPSSLVRVARYGWIKNVVRANDARLRAYGEKLGRRTADIFVGYANGSTTSREVVDRLVAERRSTRHVKFDASPVETAVTFRVREFANARKARIVGAAAVSAYNRRASEHNDTKPQRGLETIEPYRGSTDLDLG